MTAAKRVAIITGANSGVGYAIVERLVAESPNPLIIILACRNKSRAQEALTALQLHFLTRSKDHPSQLTPELKVELVDVGSVSSTLDFVTRIKLQYTRVDYLFCNAGILPSEGIMWSKIILDCFREPHSLVTRSDVLIQPKQHLTQDGIGNVLACNVFGHYLMIRGLEDQLNGTEEDPGRVIWTSSLTAEKNSFDIHDWQGLESKAPYESSKWVTDLLSIRLNEIWAAEGPTIASSTTGSTLSGSEDGGVAVRRVTRSSSKAALVSSTTPTPCKKNIISIATQPGVVASGIGGLAAWIVMLRVALHYLVRFFGERNQTISSYHGAHSNVHVALKNPVSKLDYMTKYGSQVERFGKEKLLMAKMVEYEEAQAGKVLQELETLRTSFVKGGRV